MFAPARRPQTLFGAAMVQLALIYHVTVHNLRVSDRNPLVGLLMVALRSVMMIAGFAAMFYIVGVRRSPLRGDFLLYIMSGIFLYQAHTLTCQAVASAGSSTTGMMKHGPMNTAVVISAAALASLYRIVFSVIVVGGAYWLWKPYHLDSPLGCIGMILLSWFSGVAFGMVFLAIRPWAPKFAMILTQVYQRIQMMASGKMFVANALPAFMLYYFDWNPLFHMIDQMRGFMFVNYTPQHSSVTYPVYFSLAVLMIGLMGEFVTRNAASVSWTAGR